MWDVLNCALCRNEKKNLEVHKIFSGGQYVPVSQPRK